jgi:3-oxoadipate enol-lactonase
MAALKYDVAGRRNGPALLLVHALGADRTMWDRCIDLWSDSYRIVACDLRGAGESVVPDRPWTPREHAADLEEVRRELGLDVVVPIGCAIGSVVVAFYASYHPAHVRALVLCEPTLQIGEASRARISERVALIRRDGMKALVPAAIDLAFADMPHDERYHEYTRRFLRNDPAGYESIAMGMVGADLSDALGAMNLPSLVVVGRSDKLFPPERAFEVHQHLKGSRYTVLEDAAHFPPYQTPKAFVDVVGDFLRSHRL